MHLEVEGVTYTQLPMTNTQGCLIGYEYKILKSEVPNPAEVLIDRVIGRDVFFKIRPVWYQLKVTDGRHDAKRVERGTSGTERGGI